MELKNVKFEYYFGDTNVLAIPNNVAIKEGVIALTGGYDHQGRPIVVFPIDMSLKIQMEQVSKTELVDALIYYWGIIRVPDKAAGLAILIDFRAGSTIILDTIIATLNSFKAQYSISVGCVYIIRPQDSDLSNRLKIQLGLKKLNFFTRLFVRKQAFTCVAEFQCVLVKTSFDLVKFIDLKLLTHEFGGTLNYDHAIWLLLKQDIDTYLGNLLRIKNEFPEAEEKIRLLSNYENAESELVADEAIGWIRRRFNEILSSCGLEDIFAETDVILRRLSPTKTDQELKRYFALKGNPQLANYRVLVTAIRAKLVELESHFQNLLSNLEKKMNLSYEFNEVKDLGGDAVSWIQMHGISALALSPNIASNLNEAESIARDFHNELFVPGMKSIAKCEDICNTMQKNVFANDSGDSVIEKSQYLHKLQTTISNFNHNLQSRRKLFSDVYQFHLILNRIITWLKRTIKSLPIELIEYHKNMPETQPFPFGTVWKTKIHQYLLRHPCPKQHQIDLIEKVTPMMRDIDVRNEARLLTYRLHVLMKLLSSNDATVGDVREVIEWKCRLKADADVKRKSEETSQKKDDFGNRTSLFMRPKSQDFEIEDCHAKELNETKEVTKPPLYHKMSKTLSSAKIKTSPHYNKIVSKNNLNANRLARSQPKLHVGLDGDNDHERTKELIQLAEKTVKDSLEDTHLISERDLRVSTKMRDEEELSMILNQLLYDINSQHNSASQKSSRNPSSLRDFDNFTDLQQHNNSQRQPRRNNGNYF